MLRLHRHRGGRAGAGTELDAESRRGRIHERRRARTDIRREPRAAPRRARGRENHALVGVAACGLGGVPRADAGAPASHAELPRMGGASGKDAGPPRHGRLPRRLRRDVGPVVSAPIRRRRSPPSPCDRHQTLAMVAMGAGYRATAKSSLPKHWRPRAKHTHVAAEDATEQGELFLNIVRELNAQRGDTLASSLRNTARRRRLDQRRSRERGLRRRQQDGQE